MGQEADDDRRSQDTMPMLIVHTVPGYLRSYRANAPGSAMSVWSAPLLDQDGFRVSRFDLHDRK